jgi:hypothetical protein
MRRMWRWGLVLLVWLAVPAAVAQAAAPVKLGSGRLLALAARAGVGYAVIGRNDPSRPLALVRSNGSGAGRPTAFGGPGAENVDMAAGPGGVEIAWSRTVSSAFQYFTASAQDIAHPKDAGLGTGPPQLDQGRLAFPDRVGNATLGGDVLSHDAPEHRHLPLDAAQGLVLDLDQQRRSTQLRLLGSGAPTSPILSLARLADVDATLAVANGTAYIAYATGGRTFLATQNGDAWSTRTIAAGTAGRPAVVRANGRTSVAYARNGAVYLDRTRLAAGGGPALAADQGRIFAGWTHGAAAYLVRAR